MSEPIIIAMIVAIPPTLAAIATFIVHGKKISDHGKKIDEIHILVNDRLDRALDRIEQLNKALADKPEGGTE